MASAEAPLGPRQAPEGTRGDWELPDKEICRFVVLRFAERLQIAQRGPRPNREAPASALSVTSTRPGAPYGHLAPPSPLTSMLGLLPLDLGRLVIVGLCDPRVGITCVLRR